VRALGLNPSVKSQVQSTHLKERTPKLGFWSRSTTWIDEVAYVGHEGVRKKARGGAPLMRGAHNKSQVTNEWLWRRGGVS
jgi:hypothetical protein